MKEKKPKGLFPLQLLSCLVCYSPNTWQLSLQNMLVFINFMLEVHCEAYSKKRRERKIVGMGTWDGCYFDNVSFCHRLEYLFGQKWLHLQSKSNQILTERIYCAFTLCCISSVKCYLFIQLLWINPFVFKHCRLKMSLQGRSQQTRLTPRSLAVTGDTPLTLSKSAYKLLHVWVNLLLKIPQLVWYFGPVCFWISWGHTFLAWHAPVVTYSHSR